MLNPYEYLAASYDGLTRDVGYEAWADFLVRLMTRGGRKVRTVLDLACGTGTLTWLLARRGYDMVGVDISPEMLSMAQGKGGPEPPDPAPLFLCQSMDRLDLYDTVDACVCCLDSVNYVTKPDVLQKAFERVHLFLNPGGIFIFDVNTPEKLESLDGQVFMDELEDVCCIWRTEFSRRTRLCTYCLDLFRLRKDSGLWERGTELHRERAYTAEELQGMLKAAGFQSVRTYGDLKLRPPAEKDMRIFFAAER